MAVLILHYYLNLLNKIYIIFFSSLFIITLYLLLFFNYKKIFNSDYFIEIPRGAELSHITNLILHDDVYLNKKLYLLYLKIYNKYFNKIKFGEFEIDKNFNLIEITQIISKPSNVYRDLVIIEGWQSYQLEKTLKKIFNKQYEIPYDSILADTYKYQSHNSFKEIYNLMKTSKDKFFTNNMNNKLFKNYTVNEIMIIASLIEKEGKSYTDKKLISSVILNRLNDNIKLQIDATTIFAITKGRFKFNRNLTFKDLKKIDPYNTYHINRLPPSPICFVSRKTIEILLENYKSEYLFYFFDENKDKHIFSKSFKEHKEKLKEYRKK